ncbi:tetratricopeptide repeat protein [Streptomyces sp. MN03-5084-2B]|nr:tetratricopeptide repeat protein [Streptomyces sp. MN03-5084-2B]
MHGNIAAQVGDGNTVNIVQPPLRSVEWPVRVGVPPRQADRYQHRDVEQELSRVLASGDTAVLVGAVQVSDVVLSGLGGVGKSQLAANHAWQAWPDTSVDLAVWINAASRDGILTGYADAAGQVLRDVAPSIGQRPPEDVARAFLAWLASTDRRWLIVLDDLQEPVDLRGLWPPASSAGQIVVTTRRRDAALGREDRHVIEIDVFTEEVSLAYLIAKLSGHAVTESDREQLKALAVNLGYLPLALAQAAAFIADNPLMSVPDYRKRLANRKKLAQAMPDDGSLPDEHQATVAATWSLSIERANALTPQGFARPLLELISVLDPAGVPVALFITDAVLRFLAAATSTEADSGTIQDALGCLHRFSLITLERNQPERAVQAHALVQRAVRDTLPDEHLSDLARTAADALMGIWPSIDRDPALTLALRSTATILHTTTFPALWNPDGHPVLFRAGQSLLDAGLISAATSYFHDLWREADGFLGADHLDTLHTRNELATCRARAGDVAGAIAEFERLLSDRRRVLGPDHLDTLVARNNLATWRARAGDAAGAIAEFERLLDDRRRVLGPDHRHTLATRNNLASCRAEAGDVAGAVAEFERLLDDRRRVLGPDHLDTLLTRNNLATWRARAGDAAGAIAEFERLLDDRRRILGPDHPDTLATRNNLASCRAEVGDVAGAIAEFERLLSDQIEVVGPDHPHTLVARNNLATWRAEAGDAAGAIAEFERLLDDRRRILGADHPDTLATRNNLASCRAEVGDAAGAIAEFERLLSDQIEVVGPDHPDTLLTRSNLASWRARAGDAAGAVAEFERLLDDRQRIQGPDHPDTLVARNNLASWRARAGDVAGAIAEFERLLSDQIEVVGPDHPHTLVARSNLASWRAEAGDVAGAVAEFERLLDDRRRILGADHPDTLATRNNLDYLRRKLDTSDRVDS